MGYKFPSSQWVCPCGGVLVEELESGFTRTDSTGSCFNYQYNCPKCGAKWHFEIVSRFGHEESSWRRLAGD